MNDHEVLEVAVAGIFDDTDDVELQRGLIFTSFGEADSYLRRYALQRRFKVGIKETRYFGNEKARGIRSIRYQCSRSGKTRPSSSTSSGKSRLKRSLKCGCPFSVVIHAIEETIAVDFVQLDHNHEFLSEAEFLLDPIFGKRTPEQIEELELLAQTSLNAKEMRQVLLSKYRFSYRKISDLYNDVQRVKSSAATASAPRGIFNQQQQLKDQRSQELFQIAKEICQVASETDRTFSHVLDIFQGF